MLNVRRTVWRGPVANLSRARAALQDEAQVVEIVSAKGTTFRWCALGGVAGAK